MGAARAPVAGSGICPACRQSVSKPNLRSAIGCDSSRGGRLGALRLFLGLRRGAGLLALGTRCPAILRGRHADLIEEKAREVALGREAELGRDLTDLAAAGGQARDRGLDAQHVEIDARREAGAELKEVVEPRA